MISSKKDTEEKKIILYELQLLIKKLYPHTKTINPYRYQVNDYLQGLPLQDQLLHNELLHAITLLNQRGRLKDHSKIISSQLDVIIAMELIQDSKINASAISSYHVLYEMYQNRVFTLYDYQTLFEVFTGVEFNRKDGTQARG